MSSKDIYSKTLPFNHSRIKIQVKIRFRIVYSAADDRKELIDMDEEAETKAIEKWLRMVDKPLATKEGGKKGAEPGDESGQTNEQKL